MTIEFRIESLLSQISMAARDAGRSPESVTCLAVSKMHSVSEIREVVRAGIHHIGESTVQEALPKMALLTDLPITWHFIGPIQSNKTADIARHFDWVHSVERDKIAERLSQQRPPELPPLNVCVQVNISGEASKSGVTPEACLPLIRRIQTLPQLKIRGLMAIPAPSQNREVQRKAFRALAQLLEDCNRELDGSLDTLSMGMSGDFIAAIHEGATIVRIGSALFGSRSSSHE